MSNFMRKLLVVLLGVLCAAPLAGAASKAGFTLIVAPARYSVLQVAFDVLAKRSSVLVSYRGEASTAEPLLYAWNGTEWVFVALKDYQDVRFLQEMPSRVVLLGDDEALPAVLRDATAWSARVERITALDNASLVNEFDRVFKWRADEWNWFAKRYNLNLADESEPLRKSSWYDQPGPLKRGPNNEPVPAASPARPREAKTPPADLPAAPVGETVTSPAADAVPSLVVPAPRVDMNRRIIVPAPVETPDTPETPAMPEGSVAPDLDAVPVE